MENKERVSRPKSKDYPANTLAQSIDFISNFKDYPFGRPIAYDTAAKALNVSVDNKSFKYLLSSSRQYGLISTASGKTLSLLESARRLIRPTESEQSLSRLKIECFSTPKVYSELITQYEGQSVPPIDTLVNVLVNYHGILPKAAKTAAQTFIETATEVGVVRHGVLSVDISNPIAEKCETETSNAQEDTAIINKVDPLGKVYSFEIPTLSGKSAKIQIPNDVTEKDLDYIDLYVKNMLPAFILNLKDELKRQ